MGTELFHFSSTLAPVINVDLVIKDSSGRILLSWRDDAYNGSGWHVPDSCIRYNESLEHAIQRCAQDEVGCVVSHSDEPIKVFELHREKIVEGISDQRECAHYISLAFACELPDGYDIQIGNVPHGIVGHLAWFESAPDNMVETQSCYKNGWDDLKYRMKKETK